MDAVFAFASKIGHGVLVFYLFFVPVNEQSQWAGSGGGCGEVVLVVLMGRSQEHQKPKTDCRTGTEHCTYPELSQAEISLLALNYMN